MEKGNGLEEGAQRGDASCSTWSLTTTNFEIFHSQLLKS